MASIYANGARAHHKFTLAANEISTSKDDNASSVSFQFSLSPVVSGYDWRYWGNSISYTVTVNGNAYTGTIPDYDGYSTVILKSGNLSVPHNADGSKTLTFGFTVTDKAGMSYTCGNASATGSVALTRILRNPPTVTASVEDINAATLALTGDKGKLVRYFSNASYAVEAVAHDGASVTGLSAVCGSKIRSGATGVFENVESGNFVFAATDSYGNSASKNLNLPVIAYVRLSCNPEMTRPDAAGNMAVRVSGSCFNSSFGKEQNVLSVAFRYREAEGSFGDWAEMTVDQTGNSYTAQGQLTGLDYQKTYVFQVRAQDRLDAVETAEYTAKAVPVFDWGENDFNVNGALKVAGETVADFVTEGALSGNWHYRKWQSGVAECWGEIDFTIAFAGSSPAYYSTNTLSCTLPEGLFRADPIATASVQNAAGAYVVPCVYNCSMSALGICFGRFYGGTDDVPAKVKIYAIGKWK